MSWPDAANPLAYLRALAELLRESRLLVRELREGISPDQLFNLGLSGFLFALAALALVRGDQIASVLLAIALFLFAVLCLLEVARAQRRD